MKEWISWSIAIPSGLILFIMFLWVISGFLSGGDNYNCACGTCDNVFDCNSCQCIGSQSELCHLARFNMTSECCNEKGNKDICYLELGYGRLRE
jgi:hypothetical protein